MFMGPRFGMFDTVGGAVGKASGPKALSAASLCGANENFIDCPDRGRKFGMYNLILSSWTFFGSEGLIGTTGVDAVPEADAGPAEGDLVDVPVTGDAAWLDALAAAAAAEDSSDIGFVRYFVKCGC